MPSKSTPKEGAPAELIARRIAAHQSVARVLAEAETLREATPKILHEIAEALGWGLGILWRVDTEAQVMVCEEVWTSPPLHSEKFIAKVKESRLPLDAGLPGKVWNSGQPVWVEDYADPDLPPTPQAREKARGAVCVPIKVKGRVFGAMEFLGHDQQRPDASIEEMMVIIGHLVGLFMERLSTADALRESEERYRLLAATSVDVLITIDETLKILFVNKAAERIFGYLPTEMMGLPLTLVIPDFANSKRTFGPSARSVPSTYLEMSGRQKSGEKVALEVAFTEYLGKGKRYATGIIRDIGERKRAEVALRVSEQKLQSVLASSAAGQIIAESPVMIRLLERVKKAAASDTPILIQGETGSGKECIALMLHQHSVRAGRAFVARNCAAIPANLFESEMFGHKKGAFTGAERERSGAFVEADRGTLFLDEIGDLDYSLQTKLLRAIQEKIIHPLGSDREVQVNPRIVCATNKELRECVKEKLFREDLFYRVATVVLHVPPLRERREDIMPLARHFVGLASKWSRTLSDRAEDVLLAYSWPGNVRELRSLMEQAVIFAIGSEIQANELTFPMSQGMAESTSQSLADVERRYILKVMQSTNQNKSDAAKILKLARSTLLLKLRSFEEQATASAPSEPDTSTSM